MGTARRVGSTLLVLAMLACGDTPPMMGPEERPPPLSSLCPVADDPPLPEGRCASESTALFVEDFGTDDFGEAWVVPGAARTRFDVCDGVAVSGSGSRWPGVAEVIVTTQRFTPPYAIELTYGDTRSPLDIVWNLSVPTGSGTPMVQLAPDRVQGATSRRSSDMGWLDPVTLPPAETRHVRVEVRETEAIVIVDGTEVTRVPGEGRAGHVGFGSYIFTTSTDDFCVLPLDP